MANRRFIDFPIAASVGNNDIVLIWQDGLNKQTTKATLLQGSPQSLAGLTDVDIAGLINGQILQYNSTTSKWENVDRTDINLSELGDVTIVAPANGQVLVYNSSTGKWENSSGGYVPYIGAVTTVNLGAQSILAGSFVKAGGTSAQFLKANGSVDSTAYGTGTVTSVALTMPSAFSVGGSPITTAGTLAVTGAGTVGQYIRGDGSLANFPATTGGGSSVSYYLNGSVSQGTIGGVAYREVNRTAIFGAGTDISIGSNGYIANFITDAGDPNKLLIPAGNWNLETYFSANNGGGSPTFYVELYKYNGTTFTLIATSSGTPELIAFGTNINPYFTTLAVPETVLALTDRLALRYYVNTSGRTITLHTENGHLCQVITTFTTGLTALNGLTSQVQFFAVGTSGTDFAISSATDTHTFNLPTASATNRGALSSADWSTFNGKQNALTNPVTGTGISGQVAYFIGTSAISSESNLFWDATNNKLGVDTNTPATTLEVNGVGLFSGTSLVGNTKNGVYIYDQAIISLAGTGARPLEIKSQTLSIFTGATYSEKLKVFENGNVVISTSPSDNNFKLDVNGTGRFSGNLSLNTSNLLLGLGNSANNESIIFSYNSNASSRSWRLLKDWTVFGDFQIQQSTTQTGTTYADILRFLPTGAATFSSTITSGDLYTNGNNKGLYFNGTRNAILGNAALEEVYIGTANLIRVTISSGGNVLIGTTTDSGANQPLQIVKTGSSNYLRLQTDNNASYDCANFFTDGTNSVYAGMMRGTSGLTAAYSIFTGGSVRLNVTSNGNVLIGTNINGSSKLRIVGLPTSAVGLSSGDVYNLAGTLMIA